MNLATIVELADASQEALCGFLASILTEEASLQADPPMEATLADISPTKNQKVILTAGTSPGDAFAIVLDSGWVPLFARSMMGEPLHYGEPGADDLMREVASQAFTTIRTFLSTRGVQVKDAPFKSLASTEELLGSSLGARIARVNLRMNVKDEVLSGFVLLPMTTEGTAPEAGASTPRPANARPEESHAAPADTWAMEADRSEAASAGRSHRQVSVAPPQFPDLGKEFIGGDGASEGFSMLAEVELEVTVELGRRKIPLIEVLRLAMGSVIELDKLVGEPLEVYANGRLIAEGEAVVIDEQFGIRITSLATGRQRAKSML